MCGSIGRLVKIATIIDQRVDSEIIALGRGDHKLPKPHSTHAGDGLRIECRLDDGKILQLQRQVISLQCFLKDRNIEVLRAQHVSHGMTQFTRVSVDELLHDVVVRHLDDGRQLTQPLHIDLGGVSAVDVRHIAVGIAGQIVLGLIDLSRAVELFRHGCRQVDLLFLAISIGDSHSLLLVDLRPGRGDESQQQQHDDDICFSHNDILKVYATLQANAALAQGEQRAACVVGDDSR